jgi:hypothetical protein
LIAKYEDGYPLFITLSAQEAKQTGVAVNKNRNNGNIDEKGDDLELLWTKDNIVTYLKFTLNNMRMQFYKIFAQPQNSSRCTITEQKEIADYLSKYSSLPDINTPDNLHKFYAQYNKITLSIIKILKHYFKDAGLEQYLREKATVINNLTEHWKTTDSVSVLKKCCDGHKEVMEILLSCTYASNLSSSNKSSFWQEAAAAIKATTNLPNNEIQIITEYLSASPSKS